MTDTAPSLVFDRRVTEHGVAENILGMLTGTFAASLGLHLLGAVGAVTGGTAGLSLLLSFATPAPFWVLFAAINLPFAVLALWKKGLRFTIRTVIAIALVSGFSLVHDACFPIEWIQPVYAALGGNLLCGIGLLIVFRHGGSLGGINVIALLLQDATGFRAGWTLMVFDVVIVLAAFLVVPWPLVLLSALGAVLLNLVLALNHRPGRYIGR